MSKPSWWARVRKLTREQAREFCLSTGLHGYKFIVLPEMHVVERLFWATGIIIATVAAVYMMVVAIKFNHSHPTITAIDTTYWPIWEVDAPAVTVCPANLIHRRMAHALSRKLAAVKGQDVDADTIFGDMPLLIELLRPRLPSQDSAMRLDRLHTVLERANMSAAEAMEKVAVPCAKFLIRCRWKRQMCRTCNDIFRRVPTPHGFCCSFNYMDLARLSYRPPTGGCVGINSETVQRLSGCGYTNGLTVVAQIERNDYMASLLASYAFRVFVHNAFMYPDANAEDNLVGPATVSLISFSATVIAGNELLMNLTVDERKCLFPHEAFLPRFPNYTYSNCMASCRANFSLLRCGCEPFYFPRTPSKRVCNLKDVPCLSTLDKLWVSLNISAEKEYRVNGTLVCSVCWPLCSNVVYPLETSSSRLLDSPFTVESPLLTDLKDLQDVALFHVFVNDLVATKYKTELYFTLTSLLGALGGLSGLFVGFSLVSGFELVYFFTIRLFFRFRKDRKRLSGADEVLPSTHPLPPLDELSPKYPPPERSVFF